jgi:hypothetical protein
LKDLKLIKRLEANGGDSGDFRFADFHGFNPSQFFVRGFA